jgi:hypothetical protein
MEEEQLIQRFNPVNAGDSKDNGSKIKCDGRAKSG